MNHVFRRLDFSCGASRLRRHVARVAAPLCDDSRPVRSGVAPLVFASGAGSGARHSLGTVVFAGMIFSTILNLAVTPVLYVFVASLEDRFIGKRGEHTPATPSSNGNITTTVVDSAHMSG